MKLTRNIDINIHPLKSFLTSVARRAAPSTVAVLLCTTAWPARSAPEGGNDAPDLGALGCDAIAVPADHKVILHAYALGVQIYHWDGTKWVFDAPDAGLYANQCYQEEIGIHYAGPTWETKDGSKVVGVRLAGCTAYRGAIPWLKLGAVGVSDRARLERVTFIQRVNTIGGTAPAESGLAVGDVARVPYTAEYYFYRQAQE